MTAQYRTLAAEVRHEIEKIKGSRFIATASGIAHVADVEELLQRVRQEFPSANHHCYAYRLRPGRDNYRYSDDGEPSGSGGRPILQQIDGRDLTDVVVIVSRIFGGTKLGVGGLVRAYGGAASEALDRADIRTIVVTRKITLHYSYDLSGVVKSVLSSAGLEPLSADYGEEIALVLQVPEDEVISFVEQVRERTAGQTRIELGSQP